MKEKEASTITSTRERTRTRTTTRTKARTRTRTRKTERTREKTRTRKKEFSYLPYLEALGSWVLSLGSAPASMSALMTSTDAFRILQRYGWYDSRGKVRVAVKIWLVLQSRYG